MIVDNITYLSIILADMTVGVTRPSWSNNREIFDRIILFILMIGGLWLILYLNTSKLGIQYILNVWTGSSLTHCNRVLLHLCSTGIIASNDWLLLAQFLNVMHAFWSAPDTCFILSFATYTAQSPVSLSSTYISFFRTCFALRYLLFSSLPIWCSTRIAVNGADDASKVTGGR